MVKYYHYSLRIEKNKMEASNEQIKSLYRLADKLELVNWNAQYRSNNKFLKRLIPRIYSFIDKTIREVTYDPNELRAVVGVSGGIDSAVTTWLTAETMRRARKTGSVNDTSLVMLAFNSMIKEDLMYARKFSEQVKSEFHDIPIDYIEGDLEKLLKGIDDFTSSLISSTKKRERYSGELATRLIFTTALEYADRIGHCLMDPGNGTEIILGEFVLGCGAECSPISDFYKSQVYDIAELIGVPKFVIERSPINSTFGNDKITSYFGEIPNGFTPRDVYGVLDPVLHLIYMKKFKPKTVARRLGHSLDFVKNVHKRIRNQDHRRFIPYFNTTDTSRKYQRTPKDIDNEEIKIFFEERLGDIDNKK